MCDLIDLNSPDVKGLLDAAKLASPLIPVPSITAETSGNQASSLAEKCENVGSNPFDRVLHETTEYISKKGDPFEVMLQRALKFKGKSSTELKTQVVGFTDDFTPRRKKRYTKMNKTLDMLDESLLADKVDLSCRKLKMDVKRESIEHNVKDATDVARNVNTTETTSVLDENHKIFVTGPDSLELSILNQSAMNDTLLEPAFKAKENDEMLPYLENDTPFKESIFSSNVKSMDLRRALSQGDKKSPMKLACLNRRLQSTADDLDERKALQSETSTISVLDRGFLDSKRSEQSVFSSLSNVSSITKPNSTLASLMSSNDTMNDAFLNSGSPKISQAKISTTESSLEVKLKQYDLSDLAERLDKLKRALNGTSGNSSATTDDSNSPTKKANNKQVTNDKLIDVDVFELEQNSSKEHKSLISSSTSSSDSVFTNTNKFDKSILNEAKALARTFEELALKTDSGSSTDVDLISNNTLWMSELLPAFEDEPVVENLIELPVSPKGNSKDTIKEDKKHISTSTDNATENSPKDIALQFTDGVSTARQTIVTSLLSDLKKLVKAENNTEINELLNNLEIALNANCKNNTELLITYLNISNELQSPQKSNIAENSEKTSIDKDESGKLSEGETCNNEKSLSDITHKLENTSQTAAASDVSVQTSLCKDNSKSPNDTGISKVTLNTSYTEQDNQLDEKLAVELLKNLGKLLCGQAEDVVTKQLLKNIGKVLNVASNTCKFESEQQTDCNRKRNIQQTTPVKTVGSDRVAHLTNSTHKRNFDPRSKTIDKTGRRSLSIIDSPTRNVSSTQRKYRDTSELQNRKKRFSNDPEFINLTNKKVVIPEVTKKKEITEHDVKKEKSVAISDVKNRLKKRSSVINKKGPMKAIHPINNIQNKASLGKQAAPFFDTITPPKSNEVTSSGSKIISSTPNSMDSNYCMLKKPKSKPIASSTPDGQNSKISSTQLTSSNKNRNFSCDISPVTTYANTNNNDERKDSPKRSSKLPTPKKNTTPKRQETFRISKYMTSPRYNSSFNANHQQPESPRCLNRSLAYHQRYSPVRQKKTNEQIQQSPLKENNRVIAKVKPLKLISKLKRHSNGDFSEKENNCA